MADCVEIGPALVCGQGLLKSEYKSPAWVGPIQSCFGENLLITLAGNRKRYREAAITRAASSSCASAKTKLKLASFPDVSGTNPGVVGCRRRSREKKLQESLETCQNAKRELIRLQAEQFTAQRKRPRSATSSQMAPSRASG